MNKWFPAFIATVVALLPIHANAADEREQLAQRLLEVQGFKENLLKLKETCLAAKRSVAPEDLVAKSPNYFGGVKPGDAKWPAVKNIYAQYNEAGCERPIGQRLVDIATAAYVAKLDVSQLKAAIKFYESADGQALRLVNAGMQELLNEEMKREDPGVAAEEAAKYLRQLNDIIKAK